MKSPTNVSDALCYTVIVDDDVRPDRLIDPVTVQHGTRVLDEQAQQLKGLVPQLNLLAMVMQQQAARDVNRETFEPINRVSGRGVHGPPSPSAVSSI